MTTKFFDENGIVSSLSVSSKEDLKGHGILINPPPADLRCECCGRGSDKLTGFGGPGDPLVGDFTGALLVKNVRAICPPDPEIYRIWEGLLKCCRGNHTVVHEILKDRYGAKEADRIKLEYDASQLWGASWECRDCAVLDMDEYHERRTQHFSST